MAVNPIAIAIPIFFVLIAGEFLWSRAANVRVYRFHDSISDLSCGIIQQTTGLFLKLVTVGIYVWLEPRIALIDLPNTWTTWVLAFVMVDFFYYWWHRWTHEMSLGWISHVVHHQSEDYNLAVALRQSITSSLTSWPFYLPLALLGIDPIIFITCNALNTLYQFWIHTELIRTLGPIEWVMNTPSHHRVHHGINPQYLDKNYAGVFIVWDRIFGTFEPEDEEVVYGTVKPLASYDPIWANVEYAMAIYQRSLAAPAGRKIATWLRGPGFNPKTGGHIVAPEVSRVSQHKYDPSLPFHWQLYITAWFAPVGCTLVWMLLVAESMPKLQLLGPATAVILTVYMWSAFVERKPWALPMELTRIVGILAAVALAGAPTWLTIAMAIAAGGSGLFLLRYASDIQLVAEPHPAEPAT